MNILVIFMLIVSLLLCRNLNNNVHEMMTGFTGTTGSTGTTGTTGSTGTTSKTQKFPTIDTKEPPSIPSNYHSGSTIGSAISGYRGILQVSGF